MIPYGRQDIVDTDIEAVLEVLRSDYITQGPRVPKFEQAVASRARARHAVAFNSATSALHGACLALGVGAGDLVWTIPNTFVASANCARYCGADVDFVDIDPLTWNISVGALQDKLVRARRERRLPKVVIPVHFAGQPTEQEQIAELAREFDFRVLEDASHSIGATRCGEPVGSCRWSDITVFSFHPVKIITTGEGGMALTNDPDLALRMSMARSHGITRDPSRFRGPRVTSDARGSPDPDARSEFGGWYYEQQSLGFNYRMTDIHAALGLSQLARLTDFVTRRNELARRYSEGLRGLPLRLPVVQEANRSAFHLFVVRLEGAVDRARHREVYERLRQKGIGVNVHYVPVHLQPYYRELGFAEGLCPEAEAHGASAITLPLFPALDEAQQDQVMQAVADAVRYG